MPYYLYIEKPSVRFENGKRERRLKKWNETGRNLYIFLYIRILTIICYALINIMYNYICMCMYVRMIHIYIHTQEREKREVCSLVMNSFCVIYKCIFISAFDFTERLVNLRIHNAIYKIKLRKRYIYIYKIASALINAEFIMLMYLIKVIYYYIIYTTT